VEWTDLPHSDPNYDPDVDTVVRQSTINSLQLCGQRVALSTKEGYLPLVSEQLAFGTCVHEIISQDISHNALQQDMLLNMGEWINEILVTQYEWSLDQIGDPRPFFSEIGVAYRSWVTKVAPFIARDNVVESEQEHYMYLGEGLNGNIWLKGTADLVMKDRLVDWKTSGRDWKQGKADYSIQASLYMPLHKQALKRSLRKFDFWVYDRSKSVWRLHPTSRTIAEINSALHTAYIYGLQIESGHLPATPVPTGFVPKRGWYCSAKWCNAWNICESKFLNDNVDETVVAIRKWK